MSETPEMVERVARVVKAMREAEIMEGVTIREFLELSARDAVDLGVTLALNETPPRFHWHSDIRNDEHDDLEEAILKPLALAAIALTQPTE